MMPIAVERGAACAAAGVGTMARAAVTAATNLSFTRKWSAGSGAGRTLATDPSRGAPELLFSHFNV